MIEADRLSPQEREELTQQIYSEISGCESCCLKSTCTAAGRERSTAKGGGENDKS